MLPKEVERRQKWLSAIDREDLLSNVNLKYSSHYVCSLHFEKSSIKIVRQLKEDAIPTVLLPNQSQEVTSQTNIGKSSDHFTNTLPEVKILSDVIIKKARTKSGVTQTESTQTSQEETQTATSLTAKTPLKRKLKEELKTTKKKCRRLDIEFKKIERELEAKKSPTAKSNDPEDEIGERFMKLIEWQNKLKNKFKGNRYDTEYKLFALNLHYSSPQTYRCLETVLKLPSKSTLNKLKYNIPPKCDYKVLDCLELKVKSLPDKAKYCTICIDEMSLKRNLYYDIKSDEVIGFHNINGKVTPEIASNAYVIMLQGLYYKWKQPLAYALLASSRNYEELDVFLKEVITKLSGIGIDIKAITTDQGSNFDKFAKDVKGVSVENPFFMYNEKKIFYIFDVPHLIKCLRNNLLTCDFYCDGKRISWDYIRQLYDHQKENNLRLIPKITESHIEPNNFKKMRVKYAVQIFSHTVSAALHTYIDLGKIPEEARPTADFIESMNNLFDVLNSSTVKCNNKFKTAFRLSDFQEKVLAHAQNMFATVKAINKKTGKNNTKHIKSFVNFQISIQAIKMLYKDLKENGFQYLFTRRLNQDVLENFFGLIRQQGGSCTEPTPIQFRRAFSKLFFCNMLQNSPDANCEFDICQFLLKAEDMIKLRITSEKSTVAPSQTSAVFLDGETDYRVDLPEENAITYVSGYLLFKCMNKHKCMTLSKNLRSVPELGETNLFTHYKAFNKNSSFYGSLKMPPKEFIDYIQSLEASFTQNFERLIQINPGKQLYDLFKTISPQIPCPCFPTDYLIKLYVRMRIYVTLKFNNRYFKDSKTGIKKYIKVRHL